MANKIVLDLVQIWRDRGINKDLTLKLVGSLVWTFLTQACGAKSWTLTKADEKRIEYAELWIYRRMLRVGGKQRLGIPYSNNITEWMAETMEQISRDRTGRRRGYPEKGGRVIDRSSLLMSVSLRNCKNDTRSTASCYNQAPSQSNVAS